MNRAPASSTAAPARKQGLLMLASTYPRWRDDPEPGFVYDLAKRLTDRFRVVVLAPHAPGARTCEQFDGVEVHRYRYAPERLETLVNDGGIVANLRRAKWKYLLVPGFVLMQLWEAWRILRRQEIDVVHAHWLIPQGVVAMLLRWLPGTVGTPFVATSHGADLHALRGVAAKILKRRVIQEAGATTLVSQALLETARDLGADPGKMSVVPMGVCLIERFVPDATVPRLDDELLFVGRLVEKKGLRYLIDALPRIAASYPSIRLTVAGGGPEETALKAQAQRLGVAARVNFLGAIPQLQLPALYRRATVFVAPFVQADDGDQEGLGLVTIEALGCGCPVIASDLPAVRDVLPPDTCGSMLARPADAMHLAARILGVLEDPARARRDVLDLRTSLVERFGWHAIAERYAGVLDRLSREQA